MTHGKILYDVRRFYLLSSLLIPYNIVSLCPVTLVSFILGSIIALYYSRIQLYWQYLEFVRILRESLAWLMLRLLSEIGNLSSAIKTSICLSCNDKMCKQEGFALIIDLNKKTIQDIFLLQKPIVCLLNSKYFEMKYFTFRNEIFHISFFV